MSTLQFLQLCLLATLAGPAVARCPFSGDGAAVDVPTINLADRQLLQAPQGIQEPEFIPLPAEYDIPAVKKDIIAALNESQPWWPADNGHYGPLMIRLAWHCAGSYRYSDGRGGCDGGRIRFLPEYGWGDNTNLDKALRILDPVKIKHPEVSWGDFIILAGNAAMESMGFPFSFPFCSGRIDDIDGTKSLILGPGDVMDRVTPCVEDGSCSWPLGPTHVGNIYVNPAGPMGNGIPTDSAQDIREVFSRMGMNDEETVALIGGGHAFGHMHGACAEGAGPGPAENPSKPWPGLCGNGTTKGLGLDNASTSGFHGRWTETPTTWSNLFFQYLIDFDFVPLKIPTGKPMWQPAAKPDGKQEVPKDIAFLTSDVALVNDPEYLAIVTNFAANISALEKAFSEAWYKLTTSDMGPAGRCVGEAPAPRKFQDPLPAPATNGTADPTVKEAIKAKIITALTTEVAGVESDTDGSSGPYYGALLATLAYNCASTYRSTDYRGGCNGGRIRFSPEKDWPSNDGLSELFLILDPIAKEYASVMSYADLIVFAGTVATEEALGTTIKGVCYGRSDATAETAETEVNLVPRTYYQDVLTAHTDNMEIMGLDPAQYVALQARLRSPLMMTRLNYTGSYTPDPSKQSNHYFSQVFHPEWELLPSSTVNNALTAEFEATGYPGVHMTSWDLALSWLPEYKSLAIQYAADKQEFLKQFASGWAQLMNAGLFDGSYPVEC